MNGGRGSLSRIAALGKGGMWSQSGRRGRRLACDDGLAAMPYLRLVYGAALRCGLRVCLLLGGAYCECSTQHAPPVSRMVDPHLLRFLVRIGGDAKWVGGKL
ncbi:MAG: hypothetical protein HY287_07310 [Planctomycetes bacterium]|nr:hypothetical protein [Planctomycetota bacterium]